MISKHAILRVRLVYYFKRDSYNRVLILTTELLLVSVSETPLFPVKNQDSSS